MALRGERCVLRRWRAKDIGSLVQHANNMNVSRYLRDRFPYPYTRRDARAFLAGATGAGSDDTKLAIDVEGEAVGGIGVIIGADVERFSAEVGYWLGEPFWGRGIATEALNMFSQDVFERLNLLRLFAVASAANAGSARVLEKAGYQQEGVMRSAAVKFGVPNDQLLFARINPHWRGLNSVNSHSKLQAPRHSQLPTSKQNCQFDVEIVVWALVWKLAIGSALGFGSWSLEVDLTIILRCPPNT